jgi:hypothetical protein
MMPHSSVELELLPGTLDAAATGPIDVDGYRQPAVVVDRKPGRQMTDKQRAAAAERLRRAREKKAAGV